MNGSSSRIPGDTRASRAGQLPIVLSVMCQERKGIPGLRNFMAVAFGCAIIAKQMEIR